MPHLAEQQTDNQVYGPLGAPNQSSGPEKPKSYDDEQDDNPSETAFVKSWCERIRKARAKWEPDFKRMRDDMDFVAGYQWNSQRQLAEDRYIANFTIRSINQKVATLYARNPKVVAQRRQRLDFQLW